MCYCFVPGVCLGYERLTLPLAKEIANVLGCTVDVFWGDCAEEDKEEAS